MSNWTKPYYGITHLGELSEYIRFTVSDYKTFAVLSTYVKGRPAIQTRHKTTVAAKRKASKVYQFFNDSLKDIALWSGSFCTRHRL